MFSLIMFTKDLVDGAPLLSPIWKSLMHCVCVSSVFTRLDHTKPPAVNPCLNLDYSLRGVPALICIDCTYSTIILKLAPAANYSNYNCSDI